MANRIGVILLGHDLDTHGDESIQVTSKMKDLQNLATVFTDVSTSFSLPASKRNNKVFQHYWKFNIQEVNVLGRPQIDYRLRQKCNLETEGVPYKEGYLQLNSITMKDNKPSQYNCTWAGNTINLIDLFGEGLISELGWKDLNHEIGNSFNVGNGLSGTSQIFGNKLIYPLINQSGTKWEIADLQAGIKSDEFSPAVQVVEIFNRIQAKYGLTFNMPMLSEPWFQKMYMWLPNRPKEDIEGIGYSGDVLDFISYTPVDTSNVVDLEENTARFSKLGVGLHAYRAEIDINPIAGDAAKPYELSTQGSTAFFYTEKQLDHGTGVQTFTYDVTAADASIIYKWYIKPDNPVSIQGTAEIRLYTQATASSPYILKYTITINSLSAYNGQLDLALSFPKIRDIDFLTAFIRLYNLIILPTSSTKFDIEPYDAWKAKGALKDFTKYTDISEYTIKTMILPNLLKFEYEEPDALLNSRFKSTSVGNEAYGDEHIDTKGGGVEYSVKVDKFETMLFERLSGTENYYEGEAYDKGGSETISNAFLFFWSDSPAAAIKILAGVSGGSDYDLLTYKMVDNFYPTVNPTETLVFGGEINAFTTIKAPPDVNLISKVYINTITSLLDFNSRKYIFKAIVSNVEVVNLALNDTLKIGDNYFDIQEYDYNMLNSELSLTLINTVREVVTVPPPVDNEPPQIGVLSVIPNISTNPPTAGTVTVSNFGDDFIELDFAASHGDNPLTELHLYKDGVDTYTLSPTTTNFTAAGLTMGQTYTFYTVIHDDQGLTGESNHVSQKTSSNLTAFQMSPIGHTGKQDACDDTHRIPFYHSGSGAVPVPGDTVYTTDDVNDPVTGSNFWYGMEQVNGVIIQIDDDGLVVVRDAHQC